MEKLRMIPLELFQGSILCVKCNNANKKTNNAQELFKIGKSAINFKFNFIIWKFIAYFLFIGYNNNQDFIPLSQIDIFYL